MYISDNLGKKMPLDGPLARMYLAKYEPDDMDHIPKEERPGSILFMKAHHALCDGVSILCIPLALSDEYGRDYFINSKDAKWYERLAIRLLMPF
jgi:hypothetical protein